ncbi:pentapeptide repeat-containing protein [Streptomyces sp. Caat 7-52]|uniref:pentapeptide repeat-containing protein n=1 Tax=Streptomyces sp. Caat 7-52 TaxID=2949637 RepID=UPI002035580F|nr:pentapeptide repeat-containing protein [Streptomyces sp. Caat 7-52]
MVTLIAASLPGLAALGALLFTWMQVAQASKELRISESGQITSRFNAAIGNLGSQSLDVRLGGIYALQRIMEDSARDHPAVVSVLAAFAQRHAGSSTKSLKEPLDSAQTHEPSADVHAAIATLARRRPERDRGTVIDLSKADLRGLYFAEKAPIRLPGADLSEADVRSGYLYGADLRKAVLRYANLDQAYLDDANLTGADLAGASLWAANLNSANLRGADMTCGAQVIGSVVGADCVKLQSAYLTGADLRNTKMSDADLRYATLKGADLRGADLSRADLSHADLTKADFRDAKLNGAKLKGAKQTGARGLHQQG